ncbi:MAG: TatD family hydrolase [Flavisolibacter sp.]
MYFIDSHAHIYLPEFDNDRELIIFSAQNEGVRTILMPAIDSSTHLKMLKTEEQFNGCRSMIGLHPCSVNQNFKNELKQVLDFLEEREFIAIGEIGLDFYWDKTFLDQQYEAFNSQIEIALRNNLPISIHSRNATAECIDVVKKHKGITGVFHCFSGTYEEALEIIELGFMLGIGGVVTFKNSGLDKIISKIGIENIILETDAPYLAPVPFRGKRNEPSYIPLVAQKLAKLCNRSVEEMAEVTTNNTKKLFKL